MKKVVVMSGGASGIDLDCVEILSAEDHKVVITDINE